MASIYYNYLEFKPKQIFSRNMGKIMATKYTHTNLIAKDWQKLAQFYIDVFECKAIPPERDLAGSWLDQLTGLQSAQIRGIHLLLPGYAQDGPTLEVFQYQQNLAADHKAIHQEGFGHIAFAVDDVEACLQRLLAHGGTTVGRLVRGQVEGVGQIHVVYARDPEGNIIEIQKWENG
jgi:catechol 2,3-dioxygenase-like lactoylglutathione lyase family enzyme